MVEFRRLSYQDGMFVRVGDGEREVVASEIDVVVVNAANISRLYYKNDYDPAHTTLPTCWSSTTQAPDELVPSEDKQATRCMDCTQNIKGTYIPAYASSLYGPWCLVNYVVLQS